MAWSPDGKQIASGSRDDTIKIWDSQSGDCQSTLTGHSSLYDFFYKFFFPSVSVDSFADFSQLQGDVGCMEQGWQAGQRQQRQDGEDLVGGIDWHF